MSKQVDDNYEKFVKLLPSIIGLHRNKFALMRNGEVVFCCTNFEDAISTARVFYKDSDFSIQQVTGRVENLGFFSLALHRR